MRQEPRPLAVVDIDGVLADVRHRLHHLEGRKNWTAFFRAAPQDPLLEVGYDTVHKLADAYDIVYLSGRPEHCRRDTERWFARHGLPDGELRLRPDRDRRPARLFKLEQLRALARRAPVAVVVDDDPLVCEAVREAGFDVLPARWMGEAPTLIEAQEAEGRT
jgi:hypothetical protein